MSDSFEEAVRYLLDRIRVADEINLPTVNGTTVLKNARRELDSLVAQLWRKLDNLDDEVAIRNLIGNLLMMAFEVGHYGPVSDSSWATAKKWIEEESAARAREGKRDAAKAAAIEAAISKHVPAGWDGKVPNITSLGDCLSAEVKQAGYQLNPKTARSELQMRYGLKKRVRAVSSHPKNIRGL